MDNNNQYKQYEIVKEIIELAYTNKFEVKDFVENFFYSEQFEKLLKFSDLFYYNPKTIFSQFVKENQISKTDIQICDIYVARYIVFIYLKFIHRTNESISLIMSQLPVEDIINFYDKYHTLSEERVIFLSKIRYNLKMNPIRKLRSKNNQKFVYNNNTFNLFVAKEIYLKLFNYPEINLLKHKYEGKKEYLADEEGTTLMVSEYIDNVKNVKTLDDTLLEHLKYSRSNNILFLLTDKEELLTPESISTIFEKNIQSHIPFDKVLLFHKDKVLFMNSINHIQEFYVYLTPLDLKKANINYKNRWTI